MNTVDRYIFKTVCMSIFTVLGIMIVLILVFALIDDFSRKFTNHSTIDILSIVILSMPRRLYNVFPITALIGCLVGLGKLASNNELIYIRSGITMYNIIYIIMKPIFIFIIIGIIFSESLIPFTEEYIKKKIKHFINMMIKMKLKKMCFYGIFKKKIVQKKNLLIFVILMNMEKYME